MVRYSTVGTVVYLLDTPYSTLVLKFAHVDPTQPTGIPYYVLPTGTVVPRRKLVQNLANNVTDSQGSFVRLAHDR